MKLVEVQLEYTIKKFNPMFNHLGFTEKEASQQFGFLMNAFEYGAPPHGGIALGLDRLVALLDGRKVLKNTSPFQKTTAVRIL